VNGSASRYDFELSHQAEEMDSGAVALEPRGTAAWSPALLTGESIGQGDAGTENVLDCVTHALVIAKKSGVALAPPFGANPVPMPR
jgi:hypothetical protein